VVVFSLKEFAFCSFTAVEYSGDNLTVPLSFIKPSSRISGGD